MSGIDPFTRASPTYQAAMRYKHKTGAAFEGYSPSSWEAGLRVFGLFSLGGLLVAGVVGGLAFIVLFHP